MKVAEGSELHCTCYIRFFSKSSYNSINAMSLKEFATSRELLVQRLWYISRGHLYCKIKILHNVNNCVFLSKGKYITKLCRHSYIVKVLPLIFTGIFIGAHNCLPTTHSAFEK